MCCLFLRRVPAIVHESKGKRTMSPISRSNNHVKHLETVYLRTQYILCIIMCCSNFLIWADESNEALYRFDIWNSEHKAHYVCFIQHNPGTEFWTERYLTKMCIIVNLSVVSRPDSSISYRKCVVGKESKTMTSPVQNSGNSVFPSE